MTTDSSTTKLPQLKATVERFSLKDGSITDEDVEKMVSLSIRAFESARDKDGDITQDTILGHDWSLAPLYFRYVIRLGLLADSLYGIRDTETREIIAVGIWLSPGPVLKKLAEGQREAGVYDFLDRLKPEFRHWYENDLKNLIQQREEIFTDEERSRRWWCIHLCTEPRYHGRGLARAIVDSIHSQAQNTVDGGFVGLSAGMEVNAKKYKSLGFKERGVIRAPIPDSSEKEFLLFVLSRD